MGLHQGFKSSLGKIYKLLFVVYFLFSLLCVATVISESTAALAISVSVVEGDTFRPGQSFHIITEIRNSKASGRVDVKVTYEITDLEDNSILVQSTDRGNRDVKFFFRGDTITKNHKKWGLSLESKCYLT